MLIVKLLSTTFRYKITRLLVEASLVKASNGLSLHLIMSMLWSFYLIIELTNVYLQLARQSIGTIYDSMHRTNQNNREISVHRRWLFSCCLTRRPVAWSWRRKKVLWEVYHYDAICMHVCIVTCAKKLCRLLYLYSERTSSKS